MIVIIDDIIRSSYFDSVDAQCSVEQLALEYYSSHSAGSWQGTHCEGSIWMTLFHLLTWDVLEMNDKIEKRRAMNQILNQLRSNNNSSNDKRKGNALSIILYRNYMKYYGYHNRGVNWYGYLDIIITIISIENRDTSSIIIILIQIISCHIMFLGICLMWMN